MNREQITTQTNTDSATAQRVLEEFIQTYQPVLLSAQNHLGQTISKMEPEYAAAYKPWHTALQDLLRGVHMLSRKIELPDMERFLDALHMFTFEGAIRFLHDLCKSCKILLERDWEEKFREHVDLLLFSIAILNRDLAPSMAR